jgi:hypothetical protein
MDGWEIYDDEDVRDPPLGGPVPDAPDRTLHAQPNREIAAGGGMWAGKRDSRG